MNELRKALTAAGSGSNLVSQDLEAAIRGNLLATSPLLSLMPRVPATANVHTVVKRTANMAAWMEGESTDASFTESTYSRRNLNIKIARVAGKVTDFQQSAAMTFTDSLAREIESATVGMRELLEFSSLWGTADDTGFTGDAYQYSGVYPFILNDAHANNVFDLDAVVTLSNLDSMLDATKNKYQGLRDGTWAFVMSPQMVSKVSALQTLIRRNVTAVEFEGGFRMVTYNDIPLLSSGYVKPSGTSASVTNLAAATGSGTGTITDGTYRYKIAAITMYGEQVASATASVAASTTTRIVLTWTANADAKLYAIYRTGVGEADDDDNYDLIDIIAAKSYSVAGAVSGNVATYNDEFTKTAKTNVHPLAAAEETIFLVYLDKVYGASLAVLPPTIGDPLGGDPDMNLVRFVPISVTDDTYAFRLKSYLGMQMPDAKVCSVARRAQLA